MDQSYGADYTTLYNEHWWWRSREWMLMQEIASLSLPSPAEILDVGCGNGLFLRRLGELGKVRGIEVDVDLIDKKNPYKDQISTKPLGDPAYANWRFDLITACDVIEHIEDDSFAVHEMVSMLNPGGFLVITVPAFRFLWDRHDEINHHFRRYRQKSLHALLRSCKELRNVQCCYLFNSIFAPKLAVKVLNRLRKSQVAQHNVPSPRVNRLMESICRTEYAFTKGRLPFGTSVLAVAQKQSVHSAATTHNAATAYNAATSPV